MVDETQPDSTRQEQATPDRETVQRLRAQVEQLHEAIEARAVIERAKGALMARQHCGPAAAFEELVRRSQSETMKLRDVAAEIVRDLGD
jgi:AmiR/NasT family two-component response regulator